MNARSTGPAGGSGSTTPTSAQILRSRLTLLFIVAFCIAPFTLGDLAYKHGWFQGVPKTNKGELLNPPVALADLHLQGADGKALTPAFLDRRWWLVYVLPARCDAACRNSLFQMRQVRRASGAEADRVKLVLVQPQAPDADTQALLDKEFPDMKRVSGVAADIDQALSAATAGAAGAGRLYIMDPRGFIMLSYLPVADEKTSILKAQDVLDDLKKLLGNSQIG